MPEEKNSDPKIIEEVGSVLEEAIQNAPKSAVGFFLRAVAIAIIILAIGYAISLVFEGDQTVSYEKEDGSSLTITKEDSKSLLDLGK